MILRKPTKTLSGVAPLAVMLPPRKCAHGTCLYCPSLNAPQSYTPESPAVLRAISLDYNPYKQVINRLDSFGYMHHPTDKIELIIMGGTFLSFPVKFQYQFVKSCYDALNGKKSDTLNDAKKINEKAKHRCVALCIETRPDVCSDKDIKRMLEFGATRVELGVQAIDNKLYKKINRGHTVKDVIEATKRLKDAGFKVFYHFMVNLPGSNFKNDIMMFKKLFHNENFRPDGLKIYPCQVIKGSKLVDLYNKGKYKPYSEKELIELLIKMKLAVPKYCRIARVMREIPPSYLVAGTKKIDLRNILEKEMLARNLKCRCTRCREIGFVQRDSKKIVDSKLMLKRIDYQASGGKEIFIEFVNKDNVIFGLIRLRIIKDKKDKVLMVRELHVYGPQIEIGKAGKIQHKGLGILLMKEAEKIVKQEGCSKIKVISGVGVREYYACKFGYVLEGRYMAKNLVNQ